MFKRKFSIISLLTTNIILSSGLALSYDSPLPTIEIHLENLEPLRKIELSKPLFSSKKIIAHSLSKPQPKAITKHKALKQKKVLFESKPTEDLHVIEHHDSTPNDRHNIMPELKQQKNIKPQALPHGQQTLAPATKSDASHKILPATPQPVTTPEAVTLPKQPQALPELNATPAPDAAKPLFAKPELNSEHPKMPAPPAATIKKDDIEKPVSAPASSSPIALPMPAPTIAIPSSMHPNNATQTDSIPATIHSPELVAPSTKIPAISPPAGDKSEVPSLKDKIEKLTLPPLSDDKNSVILPPISSDDNKLAMPSASNNEKLSPPILPPLPDIFSPAPSKNLNPPTVTQKIVTTKTNQNTNLSTKLTIANYGAPLASITYDSEQTELDSDIKNSLRDTLKEIEPNLKRRFKVIGYAAADNKLEETIISRKRSLQRVINIRKFLISQGVAASKITIQAAGTPFENVNDKDRVDVFMVN